MTCLVVRLDHGVAAHHIYYLLFFIQLLIVYILLYPVYLAEFSTLNIIESEKE